MQGFGGHCMCVIGYDDYKEGGAFQIMNSWGSEWGNNGVAWVPYNAFERFVVEAYGVYPMGSVDKPLGNSLQASFGLVMNEGARKIALKQTGANTFQTVSPVKKSTRFKIQVTNSNECYTYVFALDAAKKSEVLFPYTEKHSPYCGITGTRLFPKDYSMEVDATGTQDEMAIVLTKEPIDYKAMNAAINAASGSFDQKIDQALKGMAKSNVRYTSGDLIGFTTTLDKQEAMYMVIAIDKR